MKQCDFASKSGKSLDMQALGRAGDNVTGDAGTTFVKMGHVAVCAGTSFTQWIMAEASGER